MNTESDRTLREQEKHEARFDMEMGLTREKLAVGPMGFPPELPKPPEPDPRIFDLAMVDYTLGGLEETLLNTTAYANRKTTNKEDRQSNELRREYLEPVLLEIQKQRTLARLERTRVEHGDKKQLPF